MYGETGEEISLNQVRKVLFASKSKSLECLSPTSDAFYMHVLRAKYHEGIFYGDGPNIPSIELFSPENWGWVMKDNAWAPVWTHQSNIWHTCREIVKCGWKQNYPKHYGCVIASCTLMCKIHQLCKRKSKNASENATGNNIFYNKLLHKI